MIFLQFASVVVNVKGMKYYEIIVYRGIFVHKYICNVMVNTKIKNISFPESDLAKFRCQLCPKGFKHPTSLTLHKDAHAGKTQCPVCHRSFSRSYDMRSHLQRIHQGKQLTIKIRYKNGDNVAPKQFTNQI